MLTTVFARRCRFYSATKVVTDILCSITDAKNWISTTYLIEVNAEGFRVVDAKRGTAKDDADDIGIVLGKLVVGQNLAKRI